MKYSTVAVLALAACASSVAAKPKGRPSKASRVGSGFGKALSFMGTFAQSAQMGGGMMYRSLEERELADVDSQLYIRNQGHNSIKPTIKTSKPAGLAARDFDDELVTRGRHGKHGKGKGKKGKKGRGRKGRKHGHRKGGKGSGGPPSDAPPAEEAPAADPAGEASAEAAPAEAAARSFEDEFEFEARSFDDDDLLALRDLIEVLELRSFDEAFLNELD